MQKWYLDVFDENSRCLPTWTHFTENVERLWLVWFDNVDTAICFSFVKHVSAVHGKILKKKNSVEKPN